MLILPEDYNSPTTNRERVKRLNSGKSGPARSASREGQAQDSGDRAALQRPISRSGSIPSSLIAAASKTTKSPSLSRPSTGSAVNSPAQSIASLPARSDSGKRMPPLPTSVFTQPAAKPLASQSSPDVSCIQGAEADDGSFSGLSSESDMLPQAVDVLAALASLGVGEQLRSRVQDALQALEEASTSVATVDGVCDVGDRTETGSQPSKQQGQGVMSNRGASSHLSGPMRTVEAAFKKKTDALEQKLTMSRSIMRKLYHKNVELEKEIAVLRANSTPLDFSEQTANLLRPGASDSAAGTSTWAGPAAGVGASPLAQALHERDHTIMQLQQALDAARRRCAMLEAQFLGQGAAGPPMAGAGRVGGNKDSGVGDMQSRLHLQKYKQIREDYNRLLHRRVAQVQNNRSVSSAAKVVVDEMNVRLRKEMEEREAEAALYSAKLYESERQMSDWYVERRMLEDHIARLSEEMAQRDKLDTEIESCVCGLLEKLKDLESTNEALKGQLTAAGIAPDAAGNAGTN